MKISVIMAIYNSAEYLDDSISSILDQTFTDFELLLIDDGSTDGSGEICQKYAKLDKRIQLIRQKNQGVSAVRNRGIALAQGEYIRFFDADDTMPKESLERLIRPVFENENIDVVIGKFDSNDSTIYLGSNMNGIYSTKELAEHFLKYARSFYYGVTWNKLYKTEIVKKNKILFELNLHWSEDMLFNLSYFECCERVFYVNDVVCYYYRRANTLSNASSKYSESNLLEIELKRFEALNKFVLSVQPEEKTIMETYNFLFKSINDRLNWILSIKEYPYQEKYNRFIEIVTNKQFNDILWNYQYKNQYFLNNVMIKMVRKKEYAALFRVYHFKYLMKRNKGVKKYFMKNSMLPKFPL